METFTVEGMICEANCAATVKRTAMSVKGVVNADVDLPKKLLIVEYAESVDRSLTSDHVVRAVEASGYTVKWGNGKCVRYVKVTGMFCQHCVGTVEKAVGAIPEVKSVVVDLDNHMATIIVSSDSGEITHNIIDTIESVGYDAEVVEGSRDVTLYITGMVRRDFTSHRHTIDN
jgi:copper ion binding protein